MWSGVQHYQSSTTKGQSTPSSAATGTPLAALSTLKCCMKYFRDLHAGATSWPVSRHSLLFVSWATRGQQSWLGQSRIIQTTKADMGGGSGVDTKVGQSRHQESQRRRTLPVHSAPIDAWVRLFKAPRSVVVAVAHQFIRHQDKDALARLWTKRHEGTIAREKERGIRPKTKRQAQRGQPWSVVSGAILPISLCSPHLSFFFSPPTST